MKTNAFYYPNMNNIPRRNHMPNEDRQFFFPFLTGALVGGAAVGLTRPRPIYNVAPQGPQYYPGMPYYNNSYSYYVPYRPY